MARHAARLWTLNRLGVVDRLLSILDANPIKIAPKLLKTARSELQEGEFGILRLCDFGLARNRLILLYLRCRLSGSNSIGRMPSF